MTSVERVDRGRFRPLHEGRKPAGIDLSTGQEPPMALPFVGGSGHRKASLAWAVISAASLESLTLLQAMGSPLASVGGAMVAQTAAGLLGALSMLPGGLGSTEASTVGLLALQGVPLATATTATLLIRLMTLWFATALGVACLLIPAPTASQSDRRRKI